MNKGEKCLIFIKKRVRSPIIVRGPTIVCFTLDPSISIYLNLHRSKFNKSRITNRIYLFLKNTIN